jgi:hypothetical protein
MTHLCRFFDKLPGKYLKSMIKIDMGSLDSLQVSQALTEFFRIGAMAGFIAAVTLLINLNHKGFIFLFKDNARKYWWLFIVMCVVPFLLIIYVFTLMFGSFDSPSQPSDSITPSIFDMGKK